MNHKRVLRLIHERRQSPLRSAGVHAQTTDSDHNLRRCTNLLRDLEITRLNQVWASDITYILHTAAREFVYLAVVLDLFSRRCIGWNLDRSLYAELALSALSMALARA